MKFPRLLVALVTFTFLSSCITSEDLHRVDRIEGELRKLNSVLVEYQVRIDRLNTALERLVLEMEALRVLAGRR